MNQNPTNHYNSFKIIKLLFVVAFCFSAPLWLHAKKKEIPVVIQMDSDRNGSTLQLSFEAGKSHNHPLMAIWLADESGHFIETLYVSESIGKGFFKHAEVEAGKWLPGAVLRPAALPYWVHQRNIQNEDGMLMPTAEHPEVDGVTGATPSASFIMMLKTTKPLHGVYKVMMELNQSWDWNDYWYNDKYPDDHDYMTSSQPALVYEAPINSAKPGVVCDLKPVGHSHYSGKNGQLYPDLKTLTTALTIAKQINVRLVPSN
jgi:hypothetical protein